MLDISTAGVDDLPAACQLLEDQFLLDINVALASSQQLMARCRELHAPEMARPWLLHAKMLWGVGNYPQALLASNQALQCIRNENALHLLAEHYLQRGLIQMSLKRNGVAAEDYATAIEVALNRGQISVAIEAFISISQSYGMMGMNEDARRMLELGHRLALSINDHKQIGKSAIFLAGNLILRDNHREALRILRQSEPSLLRHGDMTWLVECGNYIGVCYLHLGEHELAGLYFESMFALARAMNALWSRAVTSINYGRYLLETGRPADALGILLDMQDGARQFDMGFLQRESLQLLCRSCRELGDYGQALTYLRQYETLMLTLLQHGMAQTAGGSPLHRPRLEHIRRKITQMMGEFEYMANLFAPGEVGVRSQQMRMRCLRAPPGTTLLHLTVRPDAQSPDLAEQRLHRILWRELGNDNLWLCLQAHAYLIYPVQQDATSLARLQETLETALDCFPWRWHALEPPQPVLVRISRDAALQLLPGRDGQVANSNGYAQQLDALEAELERGEEPEQAGLDTLLRTLAAQQHPELGRARLVQGIAHLNTLRNAEGCHMLRQACLTLQEQGDMDYLVRARMQLGVGHLARGQLCLAVRSTIDAIELAIDLADYPVAIESYLYVGQIFLAQGAHSESLPMFRTGLELARWINHGKLIAKAGILLAEQLLREGQADSAQAILRQVESAVWQHGDPTWQVELHCFLARCGQLLGSPAEQIRQYYQAAFTLARDRQLLWGLTSVVRYYADHLLACHEADAALALLGAAEPACWQSGHDIAAQFCECHYRIHCQREDWPQALKWLQHQEAARLAGLSQPDSGQKKMGPKQLKNTISRLLRLRMQLEKHVGWMEPEAHSRQKRTLVARLQHAPAGQSVLELHCTPRPQLHISDLLCRLIDNHCSPSDLWIEQTPGRYLILPSRQDAMLGQFSRALLDSLHAYPWQRHGAPHCRFSLKQRNDPDELARELAQEISHV